MGKPNPKSSAKEIAGKHGHRSHGPSILWPALYEHLRAKGYSKAKAARISNGQWNKKHGKGAKNIAASRGSALSRVLRLARPGDHTYDPDMSDDEWEAMVAQIMEDDPPDEVDPKDSAG